MSARRHIRAGMIGGAAAGPPSFFTYFWRADELSLSDTDPVNTWAANTGGVDMLQAGAPAPIYKATAATGGIPSVQFVPTDYMDASVGTIAQPSTHVVYADFITANANTGITDGVTARNHLWIAAGTVYSVFAGSAPTTVTPSVTTGQMMIVGCFNGASSYVRRDGTKSGAMNAGTGSLTTFRVGANNAGAAGGSFYLYAIALCESALSDAQLDEAQAFGVTNGWNA